MTKDERYDLVATGILRLATVCPKKLVMHANPSLTSQLTLQQIQILTLMAESDMTMTAIGSILNIAKSNVTPILDKLVELELVERVRSEKDRRVTLLRLREKGREYVSALHDGMYDSVAGWACQLPAVKLRALHEALDTIYDTVLFLQPERIVNK